MPISESFRDRILSSIRSNRPRLLDLYKDLHAHPELSGQEKETSKRMALELGELGFETTTEVGGYGVVGVLYNGPGRTIMLRCELDALPLEEKTGLDYASTVKATNEKGQEVPVMHACGHDMHMTIVVGVAEILVQFRQMWKGTLLVITQPAEEAIGGAQLMLADGLYTNFPRPEAALALHADPELQAGAVSLRSGYVSMGSYALDIVVFGEGGHGARPHETKDPVVLSAQIINAIQTIISREIDPIESAVITVGAIHGGYKRNVIPDEVCLNLTIRAFSDEILYRAVEAIKRICLSLAKASGLDKNLMPSFNCPEPPYASIYNDPELTQRLTEVFRLILGNENVCDTRLLRGSDDFSEFGLLEPRVKLLYYFVGTANPDLLAKAKKGGIRVPPLHSADYVPDKKITLDTGLLTLSMAAKDLFDVEPYQS